MLFKEIVTVNSDNHNEPAGKILIYWILNQVVNIIATEF